VDCPRSSEWVRDHAVTTRYDFDIAPGSQFGERLLGGYQPSEGGGILALGRENVGDTRRANRLERTARCKPYLKSVMLDRTPDVRPLVDTRPNTARARTRSSAIDPRRPRGSIRVQS
jgi:hypothetical protein